MPNGKLLIELKIIKAYPFTSFRDKSNGIKSQQAYPFTSFRDKNVTKHAVRGEKKNKVEQTTNDSVERKEKV